MTFPAAVDCLSGPSCISRGSLDIWLDTFEVKMNSYEREWDTFVPGSILLNACSFGDYISPPWFSAYCAKINCAGMSYRHLIRQYWRGWHDDICYVNGSQVSHNLSEPIASGGIQWMMRHAGAVVIYGFVANSIGQEMQYGRTEAQMLGNIDYFLDASGGISGSLSGKGVIVLGSPVVDGNAPTYVTNTRIWKVNKLIIAHFGSKSGWIVCDPCPDLAPGWDSYSTNPTIADLDSAYRDGTNSGHLNAAGDGVVFKTATSNVIGCLASVGVIA